MRRFTAIVLLWSSVALADVSELDNHRTVTVDCKADPSVSILGNENVYTLKGQCKVLNVTGNKNKVVADTVPTLNVDGNNNAVTVAATDSISTNGNDNAVTWKAAATAGKDKPAISNAGNHNVISRSK